MSVGFADLEFVVLSVHDESSDVLVDKQQDGG
jgi:hypothetical protein